MKKLLLIFPFILLIVACQKKQLHQTRIMMDTLVEITVAPQKDTDLQRAWQEAAKYEKLFNLFDKDSSINLINTNAGNTAVPVPEATLELITTSLKYAKLSNGLFDPTITPLLTLWGEGAKNKEIPSAADIQKALSLVGYDRIVLKNGTVFLPQKGMRIGFGAIAKGYIVDRVVDELKNEGVISGFVNAGGNIKAFGNKVWKIGLQHPRKPGGILDVLTLKNSSVATSGDYERYFEKDGKRYHHLFDPRTGYPAEKSMSTTVIAPDAVDADALSTITFLLGPEQGIELLESLQNTEGIIIDTAGNLHVTSGLKDSIKTKNISER